MAETEGTPIEMSEEEKNYKPSRKVEEFILGSNDKLIDMGDKPPSYVDIHRGIRDAENFANESPQKKVKMISPPLGIIAGGLADAEKHANQQSGDKNKLTDKELLVSFHPDVSNTLGDVNDIFDMIESSPAAKAKILAQEKEYARQERGKEKEQEEPTSVVQPFIDAADEELKELEGENSTQDEIDRRERKSIFSALNSPEAVKTPELPLTEMETAEAIRKLGKTPEEIIERLEKEPEAATFVDLKKILEAKENDLEASIEQETNPERLEVLKLLKRWTGFEKSAVNNLQGNEIEEDLDGETCGRHLDEYLRGEIDKYTKVKEKVKDTDQERWADVAIAYFGALHDQTF